MAVLSFSYLYLKLFFVLLLKVQIISVSALFNILVKKIFTV